MTASDVPRLKLGVIGAGRISQAAHLPAASKADGIDLVALSDPSPLLAKEVSARYGIAGYTSTDELLAGDVDAVVVATPDRFHLPLATAALQAGKHVLVEKPLAPNVADAQTLADLADATGLVLQVGSMKRHDPGIEYAKAALDRIGPVLSVQAWYRVMNGLRPATEATLFPKVVVDSEVRRVETGFKAERETYLLTTHGPHVFDTLCHLSGAMAGVRAQVAHVGPDYTWHGTARLIDTGGLVSFEITTNVNAEWSEGFEIYGEKGHISVRTFFPFFSRASDVSVFLEADHTTVRPSFGDTNAYERQLEAFAVTIATGGVPNPTAAEGVAAVKMIEAVAASAANDGAEVAL